MSAPVTTLSTPEDVARRVLDRLPPLTCDLEAFTPWDNIPWEAQAEQLLRCRIGGGFLGLRPPARVELEVAGLRERLDLRAGSTVLDLGCGPGLHGNRLGAVGCHVTGIDIAAAVVRHAQAEADAAGLPCRYQRCSFSAMDFDRAFDAAFLANSTFNHCTDDEIGDLLRRTRRALVPGGAFAVEVYLVPGAPTPGSRREARRLMSLPYSPWSDRPHHWLERILEFPEHRQRVTHHLILDEATGSVRQHWSRSRLFSGHELGARVQGHGFRMIGWFEHDLRGALLPTSEHAWMVLQRIEPGART